MSRFVSNVHACRGFPLGFAALICLVLQAGCGKTEPIVSYTIPTSVPEELRAGMDRMLAVMIPHQDQTWYFKVTGPEEAIATIEDPFREFVRDIEFRDGVPVLEPLPEGWRRGSEKPMRFATLDIDAPDRQLNVSVSKLPRQQDWDNEVKANVNRWRGQLGLPSSENKWAEATEFEVAAIDSDADVKSAWVDLLGDPSAGETPMSSAPFAGRMPPGGATPRSTAASQPPPSEPDSRLSFDQPEGWRLSRSGGMRMAAFKMGAEDAAAELTVIQARGDLRSNVARWIGQIRPGNVADAVVDDALADAIEVEVDGRPGQRFVLMGEQPDSGQAIDGTIVPMEGGVSLFVKVTGPAATITAESEAIASFLESLELNL